MVDELVHGDVGPVLSEAEYDSITAHSLNNQVRGDLIMSNTAATGLIRLAISGTQGAVLAAGANDPEYVTSLLAVAAGATLNPGAADAVLEFQESAAFRARWRYDIAANAFELGIRDNVGTEDTIFSVAGEGATHAMTIGGATLGVLTMTFASLSGIAHADLDDAPTDAHHTEVHTIASTGPHAQSGLTIGHYLRALTSTTFDFAAIVDGDVPATHAGSAHHTRSHTMPSTADHSATAWRVFYSDGSGNIIELPLGTAGQHLESSGTTSAPTFETPAGGHTRLHAMTDTLDHSATNWRLFHSNGAAAVVEIIFGAAGTYLRSTGASAAPAFSAILDADVPSTHAGTAHHGAGHTMATGTSDHSADNWRVFHSNGTGGVDQLALGAAGTYFRSAGTAAVPTFSAILDADVPSTHAGSAHHTRSHTMPSTSDHTATNWRVFYSNGSGNVIELVLGAAGTHLESAGASAAPIWGSASDWTEIVKPSDEGIMNSVTLQNDDDFLFTAAANGEYIVELYMLMITPASADFKCDWTVPSGTSKQAGGEGLGGGGFESLGNAGLLSLEGVFADQLYKIWAHFSIAGTGGTVQFRWSAVTTNPTPTEVLQHSVMRWRRID